MSDYTPTATPHAGKVYIVTGAANGIGKQTALILAKEGASLALWDLNEAALNEAQKEVEATGAKVIATKVDTTDLPAVEAAAKQAYDHFGKLDGACNSAGLGSQENRPIGEIDDAKFEKVLRVNIFGTKNSMKAEVKYLQRGGSIVNIASISGLFGEWGATAYGTSKHATIALARIAAKDYGKAGLRFNNVCPGPIDTQMLRTHGGETGAGWESLDSIGAITQLGRLGKPEEVGHLCAFLLSDKASYITGATYQIDGGFLC